MAFIVSYWPKGYSDPDGLRRVKVEDKDNQVEITLAMRAAGHPWGAVCYINPEHPPKIDLTPEQVAGYVRMFKGDNT